MGSRGGRKERRPAYWEEEVKTSFLVMVVVGLSLERCRILVEIEIGKGNLERGSKHGVLRAPDTM